MGHPRMSTATLTGQKLFALHFQLPLPSRSGEDNQFVVVHNGIITNYKEIKQFLMTKGFTFESDTDTEAVAKLIQHIHSQSPGSTFRQLVEQTISQLEGAFACVFKSLVFPGEAVATRRGSPMVVGIKSESGLESDSIPVLNSTTPVSGFGHPPKTNKGVESVKSASRKKPSLVRALSRTGIRTETVEDGDAVEYFFASDASAIIEHTNRVIFLEDSDVASVKGGVLTIHNLDEDMVKETGGAREVTVLKMEIQEIMKVSFAVIITKLILRLYMIKERP